MLRELRCEKESARREELQDYMQSVIDTLPKKEYDAFDNDPQATTDNPVLRYYDSCLDALLQEIPEEKVAEGTIVLWYLYNMGVIIKTPEVCFGVDIHHRRAIELEPLLDFSALTHNHDDHYSLPLLFKMDANQKTIISNFFPNEGYTKAAEYTHKIHGITIHCTEADHNTRIRKFTMPLEIVCPTGDKNFVFFTSGDCCSHEFLRKKSDRIHLYLQHPRCGMDALSATQTLTPDHTFIGHLQELGHEIDVYRWPISVGREKVAAIRNAGLSASVPVWGEKFVWNGNELL